MEEFGGYQEQHIMLPQGLRGHNNNAIDKDNWKFQDYEVHQKQGRPKDDDGHDVVAADVGGAGEEDQHDEDHAAGHHRHCVETARQEVDNPVKSLCL